MFRLVKMMMLHASECTAIETDFAPSYTGLYMPEAADKLYSAYVIEIQKFKRIIVLTVESSYIERNRLHLPIYTELYIHCSASGET